MKFFNVMVWAGIHGGVMDTTSNMKAACFHDTKNPPQPMPEEGDFLIMIT